MQVILSEKEYREMEGQIKILKSTIDSLRDKLTTAFLVDMKTIDALNKKVETMNVELDVNKIAEIVMYECFPEIEREATKKYMAENKINIIYDK